jgi:nucleotide-binding universal stress UspA family protein
MYLKVLIAVDGSDHALSVVRAWSSWRSASAVSLHATLLHVTPPLLQFWPGSELDVQAVEAAQRASSAHILDAAQAPLLATGIATDTRADIGPTAAVIVENARTMNADLIAMGTRGLSPLRGLLSGSVTLRVVQSSPMPVWLAPPEAQRPVALGRTLMALCAVDGSTHAERALQSLAALSPKFGRVTAELMTVQPPFRIEPTSELIDHWSRRLGDEALRRALQVLQGTPISVRRHAAAGPVVESINARAEQIGADLIVLGSRGLGAVGQALLGSVASGLLQSSRRTLLIVP